MIKRFSKISLAIIICLTGATSTWALNNGLARTPPMGFNTWNWFGCSNSNGTINEALIKGIADAFVSSGMKDAGYQFVNIDDCWGSSSRDSRGGMTPNKTNFPNGMRYVADYCHGKGLKLGIYSDLASLTCAKTMPGLSGHESQDADTFVSWGIDYIKVDYCGITGNPVKLYANVRDELHAAISRMKPTVSTAHEITFSLCGWGRNNDWEWGDSVGNLWRTTDDISKSWNAVMTTMEKSQAHYAYSRIGSWNDPDMMEVGNGTFLNAAQNRAHFSLWCMMAAPLIAGNDLRSMSATTKAILTNSEVIAVDQDTLGGDTRMGIIQGRRVVSGNSEVWVKMLKSATNAEYAILFFNRSNTAATTISVTTAQIAGVGGGITNKTYKVRDLWAKTDLASWTAGGTYTTPNAVDVNDVFMIRLSLPVAILPPIASVTMSDFSMKPENEIIRVKTLKPGTMLVSLVNLKGVVVSSSRTSGPSQCSIPTRGLARGLYLVKVISEKETFSQRIVLR